jgi:hypothetical protein
MWLLHIARPHLVFWVVVFLAAYLLFCYWISKRMW